MPEDDGWLDKLRYLEKVQRQEAKKRGEEYEGFSIDDLDLDDPFEREFIYKKYVAVAGADLQSHVAGLHGFNPLEVARARRTFLDKKARDTRRAVSSDGLSEDGTGD